MAMNPRLLRPILSGDPDALRYIAAVQQADGATLEPAVRKAISDFVTGCKQDGIWSAIKASCLLAGPRTLAGINVPLVGPTPTFNAFTATEYNRETGLIGNASTMYIDSGRRTDDDPQNDAHLSVYVSSAHSSVATAMYIAGGPNTDVFRASANFAFRIRTGGPTLQLDGAGAATGFAGSSRNNSTNFTGRLNGSTSTSASITSNAPAADNVLVFRRPAGSPLYANARLAFYSIGEALDLALLDARISAYVTAIGVAI